MTTNTDDDRCENCKEFDLDGCGNCGPNALLRAYGIDVAKDYPQASSNAVAPKEDEK